MSNDAKKRLYVGAEASGKTTLAIRDARKEKLLLILDLNRQDSLARGSHVVVSYQDVRQAKKALLQTFSNIDRRKKYHVTWQIPKDMRAQDALDFAIRVLNAIGGGALLIDETESFIPALGKLSDSVRIVAKRGRHINPMPLYMTVQKPTELNHVVRNNVWTTAYFKLFEAGAIDFFAKQSALFIKKVEAVNMLKSLKEFEYILIERNKEPKKMKKIKKT
ncbi:MAG: hypothetical protein COB56_01095 [Robiginitomaculum sp.]|nr:MAG: hypothetical protein COB56_01095 [Robiginitomaculum sp.]